MIAVAGVATAYLIAGVIVTFVAYADVLRGATMNRRRAMTVVYLWPLYLRQRRKVRS